MLCPHTDVVNVGRLETSLKNTCLYTTLKRMPLDLEQTQIERRYRCTVHIYFHPSALPSAVCTLRGFSSFFASLLIKWWVKPQGTALCDKMNRYNQHLEFLITYNLIKFKKHFKCNYIFSLVCWRIRAMMQRIWEKKKKNPFGSKFGRFDFSLSGYVFSADWLSTLSLQSSETTKWWRRWPLSSASSLDMLDSFTIMPATRRPTRWSFTKAYTFSSFGNTYKKVTNNNL